MLMILIGMIVGMLATLIVYGAYIIIIAFTLWMAIDAAKQDRFWWIVIIIGIPCIGSVVYYYTEKKHEYAIAPSHHVHTSETEEQHEQTPKKVTRHKKDKVEKVKEEKEEIKGEETTPAQEEVAQEKTAETPLV